MNKKPFVPIPQPKKVISPKVKSLTRKANDFKREMGIKGKIKAGDLINKSKTLSKKDVAIMGLV